MWLLREIANSGSGAGNIPDKPEISLCIRKQGGYKRQLNYCMQITPKKKLKARVLSKGHISQHKGLLPDQR